MKIRKTRPEDRSRIGDILNELDLAYEALSFDDVWLVEEKGKVLSVAELCDHGDSFLLSAVGTVRSSQGKGIASRLLKMILKDLDKPVYLYTLIPEFFARLGFVPIGASDRPPSREIYNCATCDPSRCVCMVRRNKV